ncbi:TetR/AcrR family transcriptional regulator [Natrinema longum]|uniref:TetR/AcrR family transcriptional regulator n=1 Tax=Natrinema longum TaxID=370324 RepID=A0A8A2U893_9EURY|nr:TetR/AcrR family transcriptional regulator [Natrinema longum]MBZ6494064.1 TetR/AcrR family transcriptional regulator [Natrinema longum]QSW84602.1 TetR/AcrR family transcriptional regulator [Natrinema longum]
MTIDVFDDPADTREEILAATYHSLRDHGYAGLTIQTIGEKLDRSPSLIYHHYEDKDALVLACLEYLLEYFQDELGQGSVDEPRARLEELLEWWFAMDQEEEWGAFVTTILELRSQAVHDPAYREHFTRSDRLFSESITAVLQAGIDDGAFRECDPEAVAETLQTTVLGTVLRRSSTEGDDWLGGVHDELNNYLRTRVYATENDSVRE